MGGKNVGFRFSSSTQYHNKNTDFSTKKKSLKKTLVISIHFYEDKNWDSELF